jgi:hypothetical protein
MPASSVTITGSWEFVPDEEPPTYYYVTYDWGTVSSTETLPDRHEQPMSRVTRHRDSYIQRALRSRFGAARKPSADGDSIALVRAPCRHPS